MNAVLNKILSDRSFITNAIQLGTLIATQVFHANVGTTVTVMGALQACLLSMDAALAGSAPPAPPVPAAPLVPTPVLMLTPAPVAPVAPATPTPELIVKAIAAAETPPTKESP